MYGQAYSGNIFSSVAHFVVKVYWGNQMQEARVLRTHSDILRGKISMVAPRIQEPLSRFWGHPRFEEVYPRHLELLYHSVHASVPLLEAALNRSKQMEQECPVAKAIVPYLVRHIEEERGHDEWLLDDLEVLGQSRDSIKAKIPPTVVATQIGSQYYYINHVHPLAAIAYLAVVEGYPPQRSELDRIMVNTSIPEKAFRSFYKHADIDIFHSQELWDLIDSLPLLPRHTSLLGIDAMLVTEQNASILEYLLQEFS